MKIKFFSELTKEQVKFIAESNYNYWKKINPSLNYKDSTEKFLAMKNNNKNLPIGIAITENDKIIGFCTLRENRLLNHLNINPWLCNVMIFEEFRSKGCAKIMLNTAYKKFKALGYNKIYVWTDQAPNFYKNLGWKYEGKVIKNEGGEGLLFSKEI